ncbi:hypothetical protein PsorP6_009215 [Peronosclerospora sorghi]|uniref:Uncharacterized protein n=1 Tax=Peronosclerospora sorghi TaxID=230839 RepID=A0ACC0W007_9STRA|nr:hypothetical protein PsorP6_009215 [Peronosclerospora sorghi]
MSSPTDAGGAQAASPPPPSSMQPILKVMRLYKPKLHVHDITGTCSSFPTSLSLSTATQHEFALSSMLILPDSFGEIFLGNTFSSYISVINPFSFELRDVNLCVSMQCDNDRIELRDNRYARTGTMPPPNPVARLAPGASLDMVVDYPLTHVGTHVLRVGVTYVDPEATTDETKSLRKFYRFGVQNPLVTTFQQHTHNERHETLLEAEIRNVSKLPLYLDKISFRALSPFTAEEMSTATNHPHADNTSLQALISLPLEPPPLLYPQEELRRVFRISYDAASDPTLIGASGSPNLGWLHVGWQTSMGEAGAMQSEIVMRKGAEGAGHDVREVVVSIENEPHQVEVGQPFVVVLSIANHSFRSLKLQLQFRKNRMRGIVCSSTSYQNLEVLDGQSKRSISVEFLALVGGLQVLCGPVVVDMESGQEWTQAPALAHVLVTPARAP